MKEHLYPLITLALPAAVFSSALYTNLFFILPRFGIPPAWVPPVAAGLTVAIMFSAFAVARRLQQTVRHATPVGGQVSADIPGQNRKESGMLEFLVVDNNEAAAASLERLFEHNKHRALIARSATTALVLCEEHSPAVALLDMNLPDMDGYELAQRLRKKFGKDIMLVSLTGYGQEEDKLKIDEAGFDGCLTKPVSIVDIEQVLLKLGEGFRN